MTVVAAFDFDETLTTRDTVLPFLRRLTPMRRLTVSLVPRAFSIVPAAARRDRDGLREIATRAVFTGRAVADVERTAAAHGAMIAERWLRPDTVGRLRWHLRQGHRVVIVSASHEQYVRVVADRFGQVDVVATRLAARDGRFTGELLGRNCRGAEKVRRLDAWLGELGLERSSITLYAYGDSHGDRELLAAADHPHWVTEPLDSVAPTA